MATCAWEAWQLESKITMEKIGREKCLIDPKFLKYLKTGCRLGDVNHNNWKLSDLGRHSSLQEASPREGTGSVSLHIAFVGEIFITHSHTSLSCIVTVFHTSEFFKYLKIISLKATYKAVACTYFLNFLTTPLGKQNLSCPTRDWTCAPCSQTAES